MEKLINNPQLSNFMKVLSKEEEKAKLKPSELQLLKLLCEEGDKPLKYYGKKLHFTPEAVSYRINQLEKRNIIQGYRGLFNLRKLGYHSYHAFLRLAPGQDVQTFCQQVSEAPEVNAVLVYSGNRDVEISVLAKSPEEYDQVMSRLLSKTHVQESEVVLLLRTIVSRVMPDQKVTPRVFKDIPFVPDEQDIQIAEYYSSKAHTPFLVAAREMNLTYDIVRYRVKRMQEAGFFIESRPVLNYAALGYQVYSVLLQFRGTNSDEKHFEEILRVNSSVLWATKILGKWNYLLYVIVERDRDLHNLLGELRKDFGIAGVELYPISEELKYTFLPAGLLKK